MGWVVGKARLKQYHIRSPLPNWSSPLAPFHQSWIYMVGKRQSGKADQLTVASGGRTHA